MLEYPFGSEKTKLNGWLAPVPDDGLTDTACGGGGAGTVHVPSVCHPEVKADWLVANP
jgi:hypothetical protein